VIADVDVAVLFGLASTAHCAGMCGPFALSVGRRPGRLAAYLGGKAFSYVFLGAVAGALGGTLAAWSTQASAILGIVTGVLLVLAAIAAFRGDDPARKLFGRVPTLWRQQGVPAPFSLGVVTGLLPCGVLAVAVLRAVAQPGPAAGAGFMLAFSVGTMPALIAAALTGHGLAARLGPVGARRAAGTLLLVAGAMALARATHDVSPANCLLCSS
jgi:hypothetical protein